MAKKKEMTIDDLATMVMDEFGRVREEIQNIRKETRDGFFVVGNRFDNLENDVTGLKKDMIWVKDILEAHTKMLKDLDEEKVFVVHRTDRIESDVEILKKRLKVA